MQNFNNPGLGGVPQAKVLDDNATVKDAQLVVDSSLQTQQTADVPPSVVETGSTGGGEETPIPTANPALTQMVDSYNQENIMTDAAADMAREQALLLQSRDIAQAEQNAIASRTNIERNANLGQRQAILGEYSKEQTIEKMGWTGGYRTDADVQMSYLKASIGADLYGQMELQRLGYETALEQARLNYSLNNMQLANEYMNQQWQIEFQRANLTGELISPIDRENVNQFKAAQTILNAEDGVYSAEEKAKAQLVYQQMLEWYGGEGIGEQGLDALYRIANLTRNEQQFEMNQMQLDQIELNMEMSIQAAAREIRADGEVAIVEYNDDGSVKSVYGINPTSTQSEDIAKLQTYYGENQEDFIRLIQDYERFQVNQYLAAQESGRFTGSYEQYLNEMGDDIAMTLYERYADAANYQDGFIDPFNGQYRTGAEVDSGTNNEVTNSLIDTIRDATKPVAERNYAADQWFEMNNINPDSLTGYSSRSKFEAYQTVLNFFNGDATNQNLYDALAETVVLDQGEIDQKRLTAKLNSLLNMVNPSAEFALAARPAASGFLGIGNEGFWLIGKDGKELNEADFNALPEKDRKFLQDMGFTWRPGRQRFLVDNDTYIKRADQYKDYKKGNILNINLFEQNSFHSVAVLLFENYMRQTDPANVVSASANQDLSNASNGGNAPDIEVTQ